MRRGPRRGGSGPVVPAAPPVLRGWPQAQAGRARPGGRVCAGRRPVRRRRRGCAAGASGRRPGWRAGHRGQRPRRSSRRGPGRSPGRRGGRRARRGRTPRTAPAACRPGGGSRYRRARCRRHARGAARSHRHRGPSGFRWRGRAGRGSAAAGSTCWPGRPAGRSAGQRAWPPSANATARKVSLSPVLRRP